MSELYSNANFKIIQNDKNAQIFCIEFAYPSPILCHSLVKTKILKGATIVDDYKQVVFKAYSMQLYNMLEDKHSIEFAANLVGSLGEQLKYMVLDNGAIFCGYNTENIIIIDGTKAAFLDADLIGEIEEDGRVMISKPFKVCDFFFSPELKDLTKKGLTKKGLTKLPIKVHYKTAYFSLGFLLLHTLFGKEVFDEFYKEYLFNGYEELVIKKYMDTYALRETKLYWLICRCLVQEPEKRSILFI